MCVCVCVIFSVFGSRALHARAKGSRYCKFMGPAFWTCMCHVQVWVCVRCVRRVQLHTHKLTYPSTRTHTRTFAHSHSRTASFLAHTNLCPGAVCIQDAARGLAFLHAAKPPITHCGVTASNLLVDTNYTVKVPTACTCMHVLCCTYMNVCGCVGGWMCA